MPPWYCLVERVHEGNGNSQMIESTLGADKNENKLSKKYKTIKIVQWNEIM